MPAPVTGPGDHVVVVGAGFAGLSATLHLTGAGRRVTLVDGQPEAGGLCASTVIDGVRHDLGPTVLTMPSLIERGFESVGRSMSDYVELLAVDGGYRASYADGSAIETADPAGVAATCGAAEGEGFGRYLDWCAQIYDCVFERFIDDTVDSPLSLVNADLVRLVARGGFRSLGHMAGRFLTDPRTHRLGTFQALYAGVAPSQARALYGVISYMDLVSGVFLPRGGMSRLPDAMLAAARDAGATVRLGHGVQRVLLRGDQARGVLLEDGERIDADAVVLAVDRTQEAPRLLGRRAGRRPLRFAPSCLLLSLEVPIADLPARAHHTLVFGEQWERTFTELTTRHVIPSDPSLLVSVPAVTDPALSRDGRAAMYVLAPVPSGDRVDWAREREAFGARVLELLRRRGFPADPQMVRHVMTPDDWRSRGMPAGTPFSLAHTFAQTGPFRPRATAPGLRNVVYAGAGTTPGVGVPTTVVSGELAARRLTRSP